VEECRTFFHLKRELDIALICCLSVVITQIISKRTSNCYFFSQLFPTTVFHSQDLPMTKNGDGKKATLRWKWQVYPCLSAVEVVLLTLEIPKIYNWQWHCRHRKLKFPNKGRQRLAPMNDLHRIRRTRRLMAALISVTPLRT